LKVIFENGVPFWLAHGGAQIQTEQTMAALRKLGVEVEPLRWWDATQSGDVLHYFGRIPIEQLRRAHQKRLRVVFSEFLGEQGARSTARLKLDKWLRVALSWTLPRRAVSAFDWESYTEADACMALTNWEARLLAEVCRVPASRIHVIPNGVEDVFLESRPVPRGNWLVCTAAINAQKRVVELAQAALAARTPLWVIGKPYSDAEIAVQRFLSLAKVNPGLVRYEGPVQDRAQLARIYREARGFVLLSTFESLSLSALEAAACQCPLLLSDLPWARTTFGNAATYCPLNGSAEATGRVLRRFYDAAPALPVPSRPLSWADVGRKLEAIYKSVLDHPN